jgi:hypothetical protein
MKILLEDSYAKVGGEGSFKTKTGMKFYSKLLMIMELD